jgi:hypothetical protein
MGSPPAMNLSYFDIFLLNFQPEIGGVQITTANDTNSSQWLDERLSSIGSSLIRKHISAYQPKAGPPAAAYHHGHCSALIRNTGDDLYLSHVTWSGYSTMVRQYKTYVFSGVYVSFSGYAGFISSTDDWYMTSQMLAVTETTNSMYNATLHKLYTFPNSTSEFLRVMTANFLANSSKQWVDYFATNNSGTYNNQYMVVDMKRYTPGAPIASDTLWVAEQLPGMVVSADESGVLNATGYWASYNVPYFKEVFDLSGNAAMEQQWGSLFSYNNYSRAVQFRRLAPTITDLDGMKRVMRYNNYLVDPSSLIPN